MKVKCPRCKVRATCFDDMLQVGYVAEMFECPTCEGIITVIYDRQIGREFIKELHYERKKHITPNV